MNIRPLYNIGHRTILAVVRSTPSVVSKTNYENTKTKYSKVLKKYQTALQKSQNAIFRYFLKFNFFLLEVNFIYTCTPEKSSGYYQYFYFSNPKNSPSICIYKITPTFWVLIRYSGSKDEFLITKVSHKCLMIFFFNFCHFLI